MYWKSCQFIETGLIPFHFLCVFFSLNSPKLFFCLRLITKLFYFCLKRLAVRKPSGKQYSPPVVFTITVLLFLSFILLSRPSISPLVTMWEHKEPGEWEGAPANVARINRHIKKYLSTRTIFKVLCLSYF